MNMSVYDIIRRPIITEQSMEQVEDRKYTFEVAIGANKIQIKQAVEQIFKVKVEKVTTIRMNGKPKRQGVHQGFRPDWKKAMVKLTPGSKTIELFEN